MGFALAACATPSRLTLRPRGSRYALAAWALPSRLTLHARGLGCGGTGGGGSGSRSDGGECLPSRHALRACRLGLRPCGLALPASPSRLTLCARGLALSKHNNQTAKQRPQKLLWQRCHLSAAAVAAGGSSAGSCGGIGCSRGNGGGGGGGSSGRRWQQRRKWRRH